VKLALWTPRATHGWPAWLASRLEREMALVVVVGEPTRRPEVDLDLYHVANDPAHGFVYRAVLQRPGVVLLESWNLHALVFAETAGRGETAAYLREARRERGETGAFVARQVLRGLGGALPELLPLNDRVLESAVALVAAHEDIRVRAAARLGDRLSLALPLGVVGPEDDAAAVDALLALARRAVADLPARARELNIDGALERTALGRALLELRPRAHELGLAGLPNGAKTRLAALLPGPPGDD
jgi:hypothetical protein